MDGQVVRREDSDLAALMDRFVCVRIVQMYGADLSQFQFDPQLTWSIFFMNADRSIYGRYGLRTSRDAARDVSLAGLKRAVEGALEIHGAYPGNKASLAGKSGPPTTWRTPEAIPFLAAQFKERTAKEGSCIHCHMVHVAELAGWRRAGRKLVDADVWIFPNPALLGLVLDPMERATLKEVPAGSRAARAGFRKGDRITHLEGQPIISCADVQWVLHRAAEPSTLTARVARGRESVELRLKIDAGWRRRGDLQWRSINWFAGDVFLGIHLKPVAPGSRPPGLAEGAVGFEIERFVPGWFKGGNHPARKAGLRKGDVIVRIDGKSPPATMSALTAWVVLETRPGQTLEIEALRDGKLLKRRLTLH